MGIATRRFALLFMLVLGVVGLSPASAGAGVTLGSTNLDPAQTDFGAACATPSCVFVQKRLPGAVVKAPFSGTIRKWRVVTPSAYDYQLIVLHKKDNGKFKDVNETSLGETPGAGAYEYPASMGIKKGEYIGLKGPQVQGIFNPDAKTWGFSPALEFPNSRKPSFSGVNELQFNATMGH
jgi:hypothetical protein